MAERLGKNTVGQKEHRRLGTYDDSTVGRRFGSWNHALRSAGLGVANQVDLADEVLFDNILTLWAHYGRQPRRRELALPPALHGADDGFLFLGGEGLALTPGYLSDRVRDYVDQAGIGKRGSCHLFRHTMATLMLEGGADTRFVQQMLGHENLASTQLYTQVSIRKLKEIHTATHPGAKLERRGKDQGAEDQADVLARLAEEAEEDGEQG